MPRNRIIIPSIWLDEKFGCLSLLAKIIYIGLFSISDDEGRGYASPRYLKAAILPYDDYTTTEDIEYACKDIVSQTMKIIFYKAEDKIYYQFPKYKEWQRTEKPTPSKIPAYDEKIHTLQFGEYSTSIRRLFGEYSGSIRGVFDEYSTNNQKRSKNIPKDDVSLFDDNPSIDKDLRLNDLRLKDLSIKDEKEKYKKEKQRGIYSEIFIKLWKKYPTIKGSSKQKAYASFQKLNCDDTLLDKIFHSIDVLKDTKSWQEGYIPHLATFINQKRWESIEDDKPIVKEENSNVSKKDQEAPIDIEKMIEEYEKEKAKAK